MMPRLTIVLHQELVHTGTGCINGDATPLTGEGLATSLRGGMTMMLSCALDCADKTPLGSSITGDVMQL